MSGTTTSTSPESPRLLPPSLQMVTTTAVPTLTPLASVKALRLCPWDTRDSGWLLSSPDACQRFPASLGGLCFADACEL